jgi:heptaprenyl diphosphate synthase
MSPFDIATLLGVPRLDLEQKRVSHEMKLLLGSDKSSINQSLSYLTKTSSKRLRSSMLIAIVTSCGHEIDQATIAACSAIELVHLASLIHDDIIDQSDTRWAKPTFYRQHGANRAIVAGDYLLAKACQHAASVSAPMAELVASSICRICIGEDLELVDRGNLARTSEALLAAVKGKTASLIAATCQLGGLCAGMSKAEIKYLGNYGEAFGVAFQLIDDLLDLVGAEQTIGKPIWADFSEGVYTLPLVLALAGPRGGQVRKWLSHNPIEHADQIVRLLGETGYLRQTVDTIRRYNQGAERALSRLPGCNLEHLATLPSKYLDWAIENLVAEPFRSAL